MRQILKLLILLFCLLPVWVDAADYTVSTGISVIDGSSYCDGACTSADTIIIDGGARGNLLFKDFDGDGSYITIKNEDTNPDERVVITTTGTGETWAGLELRDCKYVDLRGNNDANLTYGIKVIYVPETTGCTVWIRQECDHIKLGYIEIDGSLMVHDNTLSKDWIFDTFEIHHNYIHDSGYAGMYLGQNKPWDEDTPYIANFLVHDNLLEDMGCYGITLKGVHSTSGVMKIYNNTVRTTGVACSTDPVGASSYRQGIGTTYYWGDTYAEIYGNRIEYAAGPGITVKKAAHKVYDNLILGCGTYNTDKFKHGITTYGVDGGEIYDNIIIQPKGYGIYTLGSCANVKLSRNLIGDAGSGEWGELEADAIVESSGADANIYHADVATFNFNTWSDDSDYSNDKFRTRSLLPVDSGSGAALGVNLTWENFGDLTGVDVLFEKDDSTPDVKVVDNGNVEIYNPPSDLDYSSTYYWQIVGHGGAETETGAVYSFTTTTQANPPVLSGGGARWNKNGVAWKWNRNGVSIK